MPTRRTPQGRPLRGSRREQVQRNIRPGARGTERARATETAAAPRPRFTNRMAILVAVLAVLVVSYASSMRAYLQQRSHINDLRAQIASSERDIKALEREKRRWADDEYVKAQARERFGWVMPGETSYQVLDRNGKPLAKGDELTDPRSVARTVPDPWWGKVYGTLEVADHPKKAPTPATNITPSPTPTPDPGQ
jgi:cell division protein FtsB